VDLLFFLEFVLPIVAGISIFWWALKKSELSGNKLFGRIKDKSEALKIVNDIAIGFYIIFVILILFRAARVYFNPETIFTNLLYGIIIDVLVVLAPAFFLQRKKSFLPSLFLFSYPLLTIGGYILLLQTGNLSRIIVVDVFILLFTIYGAFRAVQATSYLNRK
jgi:hypothetical protein